MLFVELFINEQCILRLGAQRIKGDMCPDTINIYRLDDDKLIKHRYGDGAGKLAIKMLKYYEKKREKQRHEIVKKTYRKAVR